MTNLLLLLLAIFAAVAAMAVLGERYAKPVDPQRMAKMRQWLIYLVGLALVLGLLRYYLM